MKICMVTGGSGGHIYPALTFSDYLKTYDDVEVFYIGNEHRMEAEIIPKHGYDFYPIKNEGLEGNVFDYVYAVLSQAKAILKARKHLKKLKPDLVFAFGGYVSLPVVLAAKSLNIKIALHEQNAFVGKANKWVAKYADAIFTCYEEAFKGYQKVQLTGNPRAVLAQINTKDESELKRIGLDQNKPIVLSVMGSQGARSINRIFKKALRLIDALDYQLVFVAGPTEYDELVEGIDKIPQNVFIESFVDQGKLLPYLNLMITRAGASTITEIAAFGIPSILIPSPFVANNHQYYNAKALADKHAAILLNEDDLTPEVFIRLIQDTLNDKAQLKSLSKNVKTFDTPKVNEEILQTLRRVVSNE